MISNANLPRYRNGEFVSFIDNILTLTRAFDLDALGLRARWESLEKIYQELTAVYKVSRGESLTKQLVILDQLRDQMFLGLVNITEQHLRFYPDPVFREKLSSLFDVLTFHGRDVYKKSYQEESAVLADLIEKIEEGNFSSLFDELALLPYFEELKRTNDQFNELYLKRNTKYAEIKKGEMERLRKETEETYEALTRMIMAFAEINGLTDYAPMINQINSLIEKYLTEIKRRYAEPNEVSQTNSDLEGIAEEEEDSTEE